MKAKDSKKIKRKSILDKITPEDTEDDIMDNLLSKKVEISVLIPTIITYTSNHTKIGFNF
jgi:hypothetical protein